MKNIFVTVCTLSMAFISASCGSEVSKNQSDSEESAKRGAKGAPRIPRPVCREVQAYYEQTTSNCTIFITANGDRVAGTGVFQGSYYQCGNGKRVNYSGVFLYCKRGTTHRF